MPGWMLVLAGAVATIMLICMLIVAYAYVGWLGADEFKYDLPWMQWLTLKEAAKATGRSVFFSRTYLSFACDDSDMEFEALPSATEEMKKDIKKYGVVPWEASHFRYRLIHRNGRKKRKLKESFRKDWFNVWQPSRA